MVIATFPISIQEKFTDIRHGISARHEYLPVQAQFIKMGEELEAAERAENEAKNMRPQVQVYDGTDAWEAWRIARNGRMPVVDLRDENNTPRRGWYFPTEFPE